MRETEHRVELLAPAGSMEAFLGAIHAGADAVYVGGERFSARAYADNLNTETLCSCIRYAHLFGRRVYLTLNTLIKESEFAEIYDFVRPLYEAGLDGVIIQDFGVLSLLRREFPGLLLHASTQMAITGSDIVPWCQEHGISRIVPARELSLQELKEILDAGIEVECFIHGAMCYCYSGMCLMSSILGGRSGNRGRCAQPCRLPYDVEGDGFHAKESYPLSLKDMCTIDHLPQLIEAGMTSFKIEGRMKKSEYAAGVTAVYRKYIDQYYANPAHGLHIAKEDRNILNSLYIRSDAQDGYLYRQNGRKMITASKPGYEEVQKELLDRIRHKHLEQKLSYPVTMRAEFREGEAARLYLNTDVKEMSDRVWTDQKDDSMHHMDVCVTGPVIECAQKLPSDEESVRKQLSRLGNTDFTLDNLEIAMDENVFLPNGMLNQLRRDGIARLEEEIIRGYFPGLDRRKQENAPRADHFLSSSQSQSMSAANCRTNTDVSIRDSAVSEAFSMGIDSAETSVNTNLSVLVSSSKQMRICLAHPIHERLKYLYITEDCLPALQSEQLQSVDCVLALLDIARAKDKTHLIDLLNRAGQLGIHRLLVRNLEELGLIGQLNKDQAFTLIADASLYCWNKEAKALLLKDFDQITLPYELNSREIRALADRRTERTIYGYIPLMQSANCLYRTCKECRLYKQKSLHGTAILTDRIGKHFQVLTDCRYCFNTIYNSVPLSLHNKVDIRKGGNYRLQFTVESVDEVTAVLDYYLSWLTGEDSKKPAAFPLSEFTTAHENRQVE